MCQLESVDAAEQKTRKRVRVGFIAGRVLAVSRFGETGEEMKEWQF